MRSKEPGPRGAQDPGGSEELSRGKKPRGWHTARSKRGPAAPRAAFGRGERPRADRARVASALQDLEPQQLLLFVQSFGIPVSSMSKLLQHLDQAVAHDPQTLEQNIMDKSKAWVPPWPLSQPGAWGGRGRGEGAGAPSRSRGWGCRERPAGHQHALGRGGVPSGGPAPHGVHCGGCFTDYMAHLVEVQHERGASGGQTFHSLLTASLPPRRGTSPAHARGRWWLPPRPCMPTRLLFSRGGGPGEAGPVRVVPLRLAGDSADAALFLQTVPRRRSPKAARSRLRARAGSGP